MERQRREQNYSSRNSSRSQGQGASSRQKIRNDYPGFIGLDDENLDRDYSFQSQHDYEQQNHPQVIRRSSGRQDYRDEGSYGDYDHASEYQRSLNYGSGRTYSSGEHDRFQNWPQSPRFKQDYQNPSTGRSDWERYHGESDMESYHPSFENNEGFQTYPRSETERYRQQGMQARQQNQSQKERSFVGKGPKGYRRSEERIKEDVNEILTRDAHIDASNVEIEIENEVVVLKGTVESRQAKRRAEDVVETIPGVKDVRNELKVESTMAGTANRGEKSSERSERGEKESTSETRSGKGRSSEHKVM